MARKSLNRVSLIGNVGAAPDIRHMPSGGSVTSISLATSDSWKDKDTGEPKERTEWHRLVFFKKLAEIAGQYLRKGSQIYVEGSLRTRKWQDKQGQDRYTTEIIVSDMQMLGSPRDSASDGASSPTSGTVPETAGDTSWDDFDESVPF